MALLIKRPWIYLKVDSAGHNNGRVFTTKHDAIFAMKEDNKDDCVLAYVYRVSKTSKFKTLISRLRILFVRLVMQFERF